MTMSPKMVIITTILLPLVLFINTKQTSAQGPAPANGRSYGLGGYTLDGQDQQMMVPDNARLLKTDDDDVNNYKKNNHADKQLKPCRVIHNQNEIIGFFQVFYDEETAKEGCTVDFVFNKIDEITARIELADAGLGCLEDCISSNEWKASSANLVPFTYSRSNEEIKTLHSGPLYNEDETSCKPGCAENGGKCMASPTSLQFAMNKCTAKVKGWIHLVGEPLSSWNIDRQFKGDIAAFGLTIATGNKPTITIKNLGGDGKSVNKPHGTDEKPVEILNCFTDDKSTVPIPVPQFWKIKSASNPELNGKHLLVFHLLPQAATRTFNEGYLQDAPKPGMPNCKGKLSIGIYNAVGILQSVPPPPTTTQTTEKTTPIETTSTPSGGTTNNKTTTPTNKEKSETTCTVWMIAAFAAGGAVLVLLVIVAIMAWCLCRKNKKPGKEAEMGKTPIKVVKVRVDDSDEDMQNEEHEGVSVPESIYCEGVTVPDTIRSDY